jgi:hypothetical protein
MARFHNPPLDRRVGEKLVLQGFLVSEAEASRVDVILMGGSFRYTPGFWQHVGALEPAEGGCGWRFTARTPESLAEVRAQVAGAWLDVGAAPAWAAAEASAAIESLVAHGPCPSLGLEGPGAGGGAPPG